MNTGSNRRQVWIVVAVIAAIALLIAIIAIASTSPSPRPFIGANYQCNFDPTRVDSVECDSSDSPRVVAAAIARNVSPIDQRTGSDGTIYMQYSDDIIAVEPESYGSEIEVDDYNRGYAKHSTYIGIFGWSSTRPGGSGFGGFGK